MNKQGEDERREVHFESGLPVFDGPEERQAKEARERLQEQASYKAAQIEIQRQQLKLQRQTNFTQNAVAIFGVLGLVLAGWQSVSSQRSADASIKASEVAEQSSQIQNRPFLAVEPHEDPIRLEVNTHYRQRFIMHNYGHTPALNVRFTRVLLVGPDALSRADTKFALWHSGYLDQQADSSGAAIVFPSDASVNDPTFDVTSSGFISQADLDQILKNPPMIIMAGRVEYTGLNGQKHSTDYCYQVTTTGSKNVCLRHNEIK